jgi:hypothetical protein
MSGTSGPADRKSGEREGPVGGPTEERGIVEEGFDGKRDDAGFCEVDWVVNTLDSKDESSAPA